MESTSPLLSVVVPFYGVEDYIRACLESLASGVLKDVEFILVDDGSPDASAQIAAQFAEHDPRFRVITQTNAGLGPARNTGAAAARGRYLTFVDSDDVVTPRGFWTMVDTLERTGSDFAAGNAWRFTDERGAYQSWTHERPFARTQLRTSLAERPDLIGDRMAWNKVYRRSFWQDGGFQFPAIRYEDYPVTLRAYLRAESVDVVSDHIYLWRDRESGTSITQQRASLDNARDRHASAVMTLDELTASPTTEEVHRRVRTYLAWVDVPSLATTAVLAPAQEQAEAWQLALDLAGRTRTSGLREAPRSVQLINEALWRGDIATAGTVARWRSGGGLKSLGVETARLARPGKMASIASMAVRAKAPQHPLKPRRLRSTLVSASWDADRLTLVIDSRLRREFAKVVHAQAYTHTSADGVRWPVESVSTTTATGVRTTVTFEGQAVQGVSHERVDFALELMLTAPGGAMRWRGAVTADPACLPEPLIGDESTLVLTADPDLAVTVLPTQSVQQVSLVADADHAVTLKLTPAPGAGSVVRIDRPNPPGPVDFDVVNASATVAAPATVADDMNDNPLGKTFARPIDLVTPEGTRPLYLVGSAVTMATPDGSVTVGRDGAGRLNMVVTQRRV